MGKFVVVAYWVVEAAQVASDVASLSAWLNEQAARGWRVCAVDDGVVYLERQS